MCFRSAGVSRRRGRQRGRRHGSAAAAGGSVRGGAVEEAARTPDLHLHG